MVFHLPFILTLCYFVSHTLAGTTLVDQLGNLSDRELIIQLMNRVSYLENYNVLQRNEMEEMKVTIERQNEVIMAMEAKLVHWRKKGSIDKSRSPAESKIYLRDKQDAAISKHKKQKPSDNSVIDPNAYLKVRKQRNTSYHGIRQVSNASPVAFSAWVGNTMDNLGAHQNLLFDQVLVNTGNIYNPHNGVFTVPVSGVYVITSTVLADHNREVWSNIVVNGIGKANIYARGTDNRHDQGSQMILLHLKQGDDVAVQNVAADDSVYGHMYTTFSGFLLFKEELSAIVG